MAMEEQGESIGSVAAIDTASTYDRLPSLSNAVAPVSNQSTQQQQPTAQEIQDSLSQVNAKLAATGRVMTLNVDPSSGLTVATIRNSSNNEVLDQFPGTDSLHLAQMLNGWASGKNILLDLIA
jgi:uncharacterized FlaG/YvyC family protein